MEPKLSNNHFFKIEKNILTLGSIELNLNTGLYYLSTGRNHMHMQKVLSYRHLTLLKLLINNIGMVVTKEEIMDTVWPGRHVTMSSITVAIHKIRALLDFAGLDEGIQIKNFSGLGYGMYVVDHSKLTLS